MFNRNSGIFLFIMLAVFVCGSLLFIFGFFPDAYIKIESTEENSLETERPNNVDGFKISPPKAKYKQTILMIVDALGFNFVNPSDHMPFVHENRCDRLKLRVAIPTVTMPRIKSLMTGTVSNFIDILRNLNQPEQLHDSILHVLNKHKHLVNFAGDRTWTGLFPYEFTRKRATMDSFFVHDFYEGDLQVIETMREEIKEQDWFLLILHFLGFDHIGHVEGSNSPKIKAKLIEMDNIISEIYNNKYFENRLLLVTGDHGMREGGGHGGSTEEELTVPLLIFDKKCTKNSFDRSIKEYKQIDLTPTLAILMSIEIPKPSVGCLIPELLQNFTQEERLYAYFYNAHHLIHKANMKYGEKYVNETTYVKWFKEAKIAHKEFFDAKSKHLSGSLYYEQALQNYQRIANEISKRLSESLVKFDYGLIGLGLFLTTTATIYIVIFVVFAEKEQKQGSRKTVLIWNISLWIISLIIALILNFSSQELDLIIVNSFSRNCLFTVAITIGIFITLKILTEIQKFVLPMPNAARLKLVWLFPMPLLSAFLMTILVLGSSSFIEREHKSWHYLGVTCLLWLIIKNLRQEFYDERPSAINLNRNGQAYLNAFLKKNKRQLFRSFVILSILRFLTDLNTTSNRRWNPWINIFKELSLSLMFIASLLFLLQRLRKFLTLYQRKASIGAVLSIVLFRGFQGKIFLLPEGKFWSFAALGLFWIFVFITAFVNIASLFSNDGKMLERWFRNLFTCSILIAALLHQTQNVVLLPCLLYALEQTYDFCDNLKPYLREPYNKRYKLACKTFFTIFIANMFYFYQGNSNSLATIDLNPGYIGQNSYNPVIVGILVSVNTYSAPIHAFYYLILHLLTNENSFSLSQGLSATESKYYLYEKTENENIALVMSLYTVATLLPVAVYLYLMILFRYHLFIYSVFAPKVFYECYRIFVFFITYSGFQIFMRALK